jgi:hypothetical protein
MAAGIEIMFGLFKNLTRKWCCPGFKGSYESAGHRGFSVLIEKDDYFGTMFFSQARAVDQSDRDRLSAHLTQTDFPVSAVIQTGMIFCPWCGVNLKRFYGKRTAELDRPGFSIPLSDVASPR